MINHISERVNDALKASSPSLWLSINNVCTNAIIDEGSELVVMDFEFAKKAKVAIEKSKLIAKSADNKAMSIVGQSKNELQVALQL